jgi:carboxymethylenebutenolidase
MPLEKVRIARGEMSVRGILAAPGGPGPFPGIVMIPTIKALDDFAADVVERLAAEKFVTLGVDIFDHLGVPHAAARSRRAVVAAS